MGRRPFDGHTLCHQPTSDPPRRPPAASAALSDIRSPTIIATSRRPPVTRHGSSARTSERKFDRSSRRPPDYLPHRLKSETNRRPSRLHGITTVRTVFFRRMTLLPDRQNRKTGTERKRRIVCGSGSRRAVAVFPKRRRSYVDATRTTVDRRRTGSNVQRHCRSASQRQADFSRWNTGVQCCVPQAAAIIR